MGTFSKTTAIHDGAPVYKNENNQYLYYWSAYKDWRIGSDYTSPAAGVTSSGDKGPICPESIYIWKYWFSEWKQGTLNVECSGNFIY